jgi:hypothetical protein
LIAHLPMVLTTSSDTFQSRYSNVVPILMACPWRESKLVLLAVLINCMMNFDFVKGWWEFPNLYENNTASGGGGEIINTKMID